MAANEPLSTDHLKDCQIWRALYRPREPGTSIHLGPLHEAEGVDGRGLQALIQAKYGAGIKTKRVDEDKARATGARHAANQGPESQRPFSASSRRVAKAAPCKRQVQIMRLTTDIP